MLFKVFAAEGNEYLNPNSLTSVLFVLSSVKPLNKGLFILQA